MKNLNRITRIALLVFCFSMCFLLNVSAQNCEPETLSSICIDFDDCYSFSGDGSAADYSEFTGEVTNHPEGSQLELVGGHLYVNNPDVNPHSCTTGNNGTSAMCVSSNTSCDFEDDSDRAVRFDILVTPGNSGSGSLSTLSFYEAAPEYFLWNAGAQGLNNYPQRYGIRVTVNGVEIFKQIDIATTQDYTLESFDFSGIPAFTVSSPTTFSFELLGYCTVGNGGFINAWDLEDIKINENNYTTVEGGQITFDDGSVIKNICEGEEEQIFMALLNNVGENSAYVVLDENDNIIQVDNNPIDVTGLTPGCYTIHHISYVGNCGEIIVDTDQNVVSSDVVTLDLQDPQCAALATFFINPVPPAGTFDLPIKEFTISIPEDGYYSFTPAESCDYIFNLYPLNGFDINNSCSVANLLAFGGYSVTNGGITQIGGAYLTAGDYQLIVCSTSFACTDNITGGAIAISCLGLAPGTGINDLDFCHDLSNGVELCINENPNATISATDTSCGATNGTASVNVSGGDSPYTYVWSNGASGLTQNNLPAGTYTVTVTDAQGCSDIASATVGTSAAPSVDATSTDTSCGENNGTATASASGGSGTYTYLWSNGSSDATLDNLAAGDYTVTVTDAEGCTASSTTTVGSSSNPNDGGQITFDDGSVIKNICEGDEEQVFMALLNNVGANSAWLVLDENDDIIQVDNNPIDVTDLNTGCYTIQHISYDSSCGEFTVNTDQNVVSSDVVTLDLEDPECAALASFFINPVPPVGTFDLPIKEFTVTIPEDGYYSFTPAESCDYIFNLYPLNGFDITNSCSVDNLLAFGGHSDQDVGITQIGGACLTAGDYQLIVCSTSFACTDNIANGAITISCAGIKPGMGLNELDLCHDLSNQVELCINENPSITIDQTTDTSCGNATGSVSVSAQGGTSPYTYSWSNGSTGSTINNLAAGTYTVTGTDAQGCTDITTIEIGSSESPVANATSTNTTCGEDNGSVSASATGGSGGYTYAWSNGGSGSSQSNLTAGDYTVTVTDSEGCTDTSLVTVGASESPAASTSSTDTSCGESNGSVSATATGGSGGYSYSWSNGSSNASQNNLPAGDYSVTVTDSEGCTDVANINVAPSESPSANTSSTDTSCGESNGTVSASATGGSGGYTYAWSNGSSDATQDNLAAGDYTVTVTDSAGCTDVSTTTVNSSDSPTVNTSSVDTSCGESTGSISASTTGGSGGYTYAWSNGSSDATQDNLSAGDYTVTVTDSEGCTDVSTVTVGSSESPSASGSATDTSCGEDNGSVSASATGGSGSYTYAWSNGSSDATQDNLAAGDYTVTVTDSEGCTDVSTVTVGSSESPTASSSATDTTCGEDNGSVSVSATGGSGSYTYAWSNGSSDATQDNLSADDYTVTVTDAAGCTDVSTVTVGSSESPVASASSTDTSCGEDNGSVSASATGGSGSYTYAWSNGSSDATQDNLSAGDYTVTITDATGCTDVSTVTVGSSESPTASTSSTDTSCGEESGSVSASATGGSGGYTYAWSNGSSDATQDNLSAGDYTVTITDSAGCTDVSTVSVGSSDSPVASGSATDTSCGEDNGSVSVSATGGSGGYTYAWSNGSSDVTQDNLSAGDYTVTVTDAAGCTDVSTVTVGFSESPVASASSTDTSCGEDNGSVSVNATGGSGSYTYAWSNGSSDATQDNLSAGDYTVTVTDAAGCTDVSTVTVGSSESPSASGSATDTSCGEESGSVSASATGGSGSYTYAWSNGSSDATQDNLSAGDYTVTITDSAGCTDVSTVSVGSSDSPVASGSATDTSCGEDNGSVSVSAIGGSGGYTYAWSNGSSDATQDNLACGNYTVTVTDETGCTDVVTVIVECSESPTASTTSTDTTCGEDNGSVSVSATGGTGGYTYVWSNGSTSADQSNLPAGDYTVTVTDAAGCTDVSTVSVGDSADGPEILVLVVHTTCNYENGFADVVVTGGTPGYTFEWSNGDTDTWVGSLAPGDYSVTVTDAAGCSTVANFEIEGSEVGPELTVVGLDGTCGKDNGSISVSATGGEGPYEFTWTGGLTGTSLENLGTGLYGVTVTDVNGCIDYGGYYVNVGESPEFANTDITDASCSENNGAIDIEVVQGIAPYSYAWSNGATTQDLENISAGEYTVTVTDSEGCIIEQTVTVENITDMSISIDGTNTCCGLDNGEATLSVQCAMDPTSIQWSNGETSATISDLAPDLYTVTVTDASGQSEVASVLIEGSNGPDATAVSTDTECGSANGSATVTATSGTGDYTYEWSNGSSEPTIDNLPGGTYTVTVTDEKGCTDVVSVEVGGSITPDAGNLTGGPFHFCVDGEADFVGGISVSGDAGDFSTFVITDSDGEILGLPGSLDDLESVDFDGAGSGVCIIWYLTHSGDIQNLAVGQNASDLSGCFDISGPIEVVREGLEPVASCVTFDLNACQADTNYSEFTPSIDNAAGCTTFSVPAGNISTDVTHSCTPGVNGTGMCFAANTSCDYDPNTPAKLTIPVRVSPGDLGDGFISGISFYEQAPDMFVWTDGTSGVNNYPTLYAIRVLKAGTLIYEETGISTELDWNLEEFDFSSDSNFSVSSPTDFTIELIPYCTADNGATSIGVWDIDEIKIFSNCTNNVEGGTLNGSGPYDICLDQLSDFITDISLTDNEGYNDILITDADGGIIAVLDDLNALSTFDFNNGEVGSCFIWNLSYSLGFGGISAGQNVSELAGCYHLSNSIEVIKTECGTRISIAPNPVITELTLSVNTPEYDQVNYLILDNLGRVVLRKNIQDNASRKVLIKVDDLDAGQYHIRVVTGKHYSYTTSFIVVK